MIMELFNIYAIDTPYYIVDQRLVVKNLELLRHVKSITGCKILLAQKAFSMYSLYPLIGHYLDGTTASGLYEARLGFEEMGGETHIFSPAYVDSEIDDILKLCNHVVFNSFTQLERFRGKAISSSKKLGIRINPGISTQEYAIYDPCAVGSRLGVTHKHFREDLLDGVSGLHFHALCQQNADALVHTLAGVEAQFSNLFHRMDWVNFGGGHHITRNNYDIDSLTYLINVFQSKYNVQVYLEPGEAVVLDAGYLVTTVVDIVENGLKIAVLDSSAACHMPDVIEMPYRPNIIGSGHPNQKPFTYRLAGPTCLAGDIIGDYSFDQPLKTGDRLVFCDMAHYSMVKNNTFNGMRLPTIATVDSSGSIKVVRTFGYNDFKSRL